MEKLLNSPRALCLSSFTVSRWMDNPQIKDEADKITCARCHLPSISEGWECLPSTQSHFPQLDLPDFPPPITPSMECGLLRKVKSSGGCQKPTGSFQAAWSHRMGDCGSPLRSWSFTHILLCKKPQLSSLPPCASLCIRAGPNPSEGNDPS